MNDQQIIGVKEFIGILNETLQFAFPQVTVEGEVNSFKVNQGKWVFFDLKDDEASFGCFMPLYQLKVPLEDGMKVRVSGLPRLTKWGKFSFTVQKVELAGEGELRRAFVLLKERLGAEGLFADSRKRALPRYPRRIGLITSAASAAYSDFMKILGERWGGLVVNLADVQVQGAPAPGQVVGALQYFNQLSPAVDVVVLIRGGGSLEDLQAFNTEEVARAVAASRSPIIVGVGHEVDISLADYAADVRAATPTDAARLVVPDRVGVLQAVEFAENTLTGVIGRSLVRSEQRTSRASDVMMRFLARPRARIASNENLLRRDYYRFEARLAGYQRAVAALELGLQNRQGQNLRQVQRRLTGLSRVLESFSPEANLKRGYAIVTHDDRVVQRVKQVSPGDHLMIQLSDGKLKSQVEE